MPRLRSASVRRIGLAAARRSATIVALVALLSSLSCAGPPSACAPVSGGEQASVVQLRHVSFGDDQVSLLFVQRPGGADGVPPSPVIFQSGGRTVWVPRSAARGWLDTVLFVPDLPPGEHVVLVRDAAGAAPARPRRGGGGG